MKVPYNGKEVEAEQIEFIVDSEPFGVLSLADGKKIRAKTVITAAYKLPGEKDQLGRQIYFFEHQFIAVVDDK